MLLIYYHCVSVCEQVSSTYDYVFWEILTERGSGGEVIRKGETIHGRTHIYFSWRLPTLSQLFSLVHTHSVSQIKRKEMLDRESKF